MVSCGLERRGGGLLKASVLAPSTWGKQDENVLKRPGMRKG